MDFEAVSRLREREREENMLSNLFEPTILVGFLVSRRERASERPGTNSFRAVVLKKEREKGPETEENCLKEPQNHSRTATSSFGACHLPATDRLLQEPQLHS